MLKTIAAIVALVALLSLNAVVGHATDEAPSIPTGGLGYDCDYQNHVCYCDMTNPRDCERMLDTEICQASERAGYPWTEENEGFGLPFYYFVDCDSTTGRCSCDMTPEAMRAGTSRRPERFVPANENAQDDIVTPNNRTADQPGETVPARRGTAPTSDTATDGASEAEEETTPTERRVRDHR